MHYRRIEQPKLNCANWIEEGTRSSFGSRPAY